MTHQGVNFKILTYRKSKFHLVYHIVSFFSRVVPDEYFSTKMTHQIWKIGNIISFDQLKLTGQKTQKKSIFPFQQAKQNHDNNPWYDCSLRILTANTYSHLKRKFSSWYLRVPVWDERKRFPWDGGNYLRMCTPVFLALPQLPSLTSRSVPIHFKPFIKIHFKIWPLVHFIRKKWSILKYILRSVDWAGQKYKRWVLCVFHNFWLN